MNPSFITLTNGHRIAYRLTEGSGPGIVFLGGFRSDMTGTKAVMLEAFAREKGRRFLRFDYSGHGESSGDFMDGTIGAWADDAAEVIGQLMPGKNIVVGSSMGGWIMLLVARRRPEAVAGLVGIASAPDFTKSLIEQEMTDAQRREIQDKGVVYVPSCYGQEPYPITWKLIQEGRENLLLDAPIALDMPVRLMHGIKDNDVPYQTSLKLMECLTSRDVRMTLVKDAGHRFSEAHELAMIKAAVEEVISLSSV